MGFVSFTVTSNTSGYQAGQLLTHLSFFSTVPFLPSTKLEDETNTYTYAFSSGRHEPREDPTIRLDRHAWLRERGGYDGVVLGEEVEVDFVAYGRFDVFRAVGETIRADGDGVRCRIGQQGGEGQG